MQYERRYRDITKALDSEKSKEYYFKVHKCFADFANLKSIEDILNVDPMLLESQIIEFIVHLKEKGRKYNTIKMYASALKQTLDINKINIDWKYSVNRHIGKKTKVKDRCYERDEIQKLLQFTDIRGKAILLLLASSGMRIGALPLLPP